MEIEDLKNYPKEKVASCLENEIGSDARELFEACLRLYRFRNCSVRVYVLFICIRNLHHMVWSHMASIAEYKILKDLEKEENKHLIGVCINCNVDKGLGSVLICKECIKSADKNRTSIFKNQALHKRAFGNFPDSWDMNYSAETHLDDFGRALKWENRHDQIFLDWLEGLNTLVDEVLSPFGDLSMSFLEELRDAYR